MIADDDRSRLMAAYACLHEWLETEAYPRALSAAETTREPRHGLMACEAADSLFAYLNRQTPGLWFDVRTAQAQVTSASTLYHLVGAIMALRRFIGADP